MEDLNFTIANYVGSYERGASKDEISRRIQEGFKNFGYDIELLKIRQEFDKVSDTFTLRKSLLNLTK